MAEGFQLRREAIRPRARRSLARPATGQRFIGLAEQIRERRGERVDPHAVVLAENLRKLFRRVPRDRSARSAPSRERAPRRRGLGTWTWAWVRRLPPPARDARPSAFALPTAYAHPREVHSAWASRAAFPPEAGESIAAGIRRARSRCVYPVCARLSARTQHASAYACLQSVPRRGTQSGNPSVALPFPDHAVHPRAANVRGDARPRERDRSDAPAGCVRLAPLLGCPGKTADLGHEIPEALGRKAKGVQWTMEGGHRTRQCAEPCRFAQPVVGSIAPNQGRVVSAAASSGCARSRGTRTRRDCWGRSRRCARGSARSGGARNRAAAHRSPA